MTGDQSLFPAPEPARVKIVDPQHISLMGKLVGVGHALDALEKVPEKSRGPGFTLALAVIEKEVAELRSRFLMRNLTTVAKAGADVARVRQIGLEGEDLVITYFAPGEGED